MDINMIWKRIIDYEGETFRTVTGIEFTYRVFGNSIKPSVAEQNISKREFKKALDMQSIKNVGQLTNKVRGSSYIFALLKDDRIIANHHKTCKSWIFVSNTSKFDALKAFEEVGEVLWTKRNCMAEVGDTVFIYVTNPIGKIMVKGLITEILKSGEEEYKYSKYWASHELQEEMHKKTLEYYRIKKIEQLDSQELSLKTLKDMGLINYNFQGRISSDSNIELFNFLWEKFQANIGIFDSWKIIDNTTAIKKTDKSFFLYNGSGIPIETRWFWNIENLRKGEKKDISLIFEGIIYKAYIQRESSEHARTRLFWHNDLSSIFNAMFPMNNSFEAMDYPSLEFNKNDSNNSTYILKFINDNNIYDNENYELESMVETELPDGNTEGKRVHYYTTKYERDAKNRKDAIRFHGTKCMACGFDFEKTYGYRGKGFIVVHHNKPLFSLDEEININPITDLDCVCSNCHNMIHRRKDAILTVEQLKAIISNNNL